MTPIVKYAILHANKVDDALLINAIEHLPESQQIRFVELILGLVNEEVKFSALPKTAKVVGDYESTIISYNYVLDEVTYNKVHDSTLYFKEKEDAEQYKKTGKANGAYSWCSGKADYPYQGTYVLSSTETMSREDWLYYHDKE